MRTLTLLAALLLLASQAWAQTLQESTDQPPAQDQPVGKDEDPLGDEEQDLLGDEDQDLLGDEEEDVAISFTGGERLARDASGLGTALTVLQRCHCRRRRRCRRSVVNKLLERPSGVCKVFRRRYRLCCR